MNLTTSPLTLTLQRTLAAPRMAVWRCWTEGALMEQWFCPKPWFVKDVVTDVRTGGASSMRCVGRTANHFPIRVFILLWK